MSSHKLYIGRAKIKVKDYRAMQKGILCRNCKNIVLMNDEDFEKIIFERTAILSCKLCGIYPYFKNYGGKNSLLDEEICIEKNYGGNGHEPEN